MVGKSIRNGVLMGKMIYEWSFFTLKMGDLA
jgi:hypothetical protein